MSPCPAPRRSQRGEEAGRWLRDASSSLAIWDLGGPGSEFHRVCLSEGLGWARAPRARCAPLALCSLPSRSRALGGEDRDLPAVLPAGRLHGGRSCALAHQLHRGLHVPFRPGEQVVGGEHSGWPLTPLPPRLPPRGREPSGTRHRFLLRTSAVSTYAVPYWPNSANVPVPTCGGSPSLGPDGLTTRGSRLPRSKAIGSTQEPGAGDRAPCCCLLPVSEGKHLGSPFSTPQGRRTRGPYYEKAGESFPT